MPSILPQLLCIWFSVHGMGFFACNLSSCSALMIFGNVQVRLPRLRSANCRAPGCRTSTWPARVYWADPASPCRSKPKGDVDVAAPLQQPCVLKLQTCWLTNCAICSVCSRHFLTPRWSPDMARAGDCCVRPSLSASPEAQPRGCSASLKGHQS